MTFEDLDYRNSSRGRLHSRREAWARRDLCEKVYDDCLAAVFKIKTDAFTNLAHNKKIEGESATVKDWMIAMAEDIEREIFDRKMSHRTKGQEDGK